MDDISDAHSCDICCSKAARSSFSSPPYTSSFQKSLSSVLDACARLYGLRLDSSRKKAPSASSTSLSTSFDSFALVFPLGGVAGGSMTCSSPRSEPLSSASFVTDRVLVRVGLSLAPSASIHSRCAAAKSNSDPPSFSLALFLAPFTTHSGSGLTPAISPALTSNALASAVASASITASALDFIRSALSARSRSHCSEASFAVWPLTYVFWTPSSSSSFCFRLSSRMFFITCRESFTMSMACSSCARYSVFHPPAWASYGFASVPSFFFGRRAASGPCRTSPHSEWMSG